jgi:riboflavin synthase
MFTGIVQAVGRVSGLSTQAPGLRIEIDSQGWGFLPGDGDSISVDGCCLTVVGMDRGSWQFDAVPETLAKTTLGAWKVGKNVNLEHAATAATFLGGHVVQGHVDGVGMIADVREGADWRIRVRPGADLMEYMVPKGSIALAGVSLTLAEVSPKEGWIEVALIPATLEKTNLAELRAGDGVNVEADSMAKTMIHWMKNYAGNK